MRNLVSLSVILQLVVLTWARIGDPYSILGVDHDATGKDIKRAYKQLAKEWLVVFIVLLNYCICFH